MDNHKDGVLPLYGQIKRWIVGQIQSGIWKPGHMLPSEKQLQQQFGVSRTTVRQAIAELQAEGFVEKHQGRGTLVAKPKFEWQLRKLRGFTADVIAKGHVPRSIVLSSEVVLASDQVCSLLKLEKGSHVFKLVRLRFIDDDPVQLHTLHMPLDVAEKIGYDELEFSTCSVYAELKRVNVEPWEGEEILEVGLASDLESTLFGIPKGSPLIITRSVVVDRNQQPIEYTIVKIRGDRYRHSVRLKMEDG